MRRAVLIVVAVTIVALPASAHGARGFSYGVAAGEVTDDSAMLWARSDRSGTATLEVARDSRFRRVVKRARDRAASSADLTVQRTVTGLDADTTYYYRWRLGSRNVSDRGRFRTAPAARANDTIEFGFSGDADATPNPDTGRPFYNNFQVYGSMAREGNHFNVNLGDTIYSDTEVGARIENGVFVPAEVARTRSEKWVKYKENLALRPLQRVRGTTGFYSHWDDHEFINDFSLEEHGRATYTHGVRAFRDYAPVTFSARGGLYRSFRWGRNAEFFFLDQRSFRDAKASSGGVCNNPQTNAPDLAPTAPKRLRQAFSAVIPAFQSDPPPACVARINDPSRDFLGQAQYNRLTSRINSSNARWKIIFSEVPMMQYYALPYDRWEGYEAERQKLLAFLQNSGDNVVVLSTDNHANYYNEINFKTLDEDPAFQPTRSGIFEMSTGPVATLTQKREIDETIGQPGGGDLVTAFYRADPPNGAGMECAATDVYSYSQVRVTRTSVRITPKDLDGDPVRQSDGTPCGPFTIRAR
jgi:phosphodiesterase/alkaline phosphatase D-like protein